MSIALPLSYWLKAQVPLPPNSFDFGSFNGPVYSILVENNGSIFVGGNFTTYAGTSCPGLVKINQDGTINTEFTSNLGTGFTTAAGSTSRNVNVIFKHSNGSLYVGGDFNTFNGSSVPQLVKLNVTTGIRDTNFSGFSFSPLTGPAVTDADCLYNSVFTLCETYGGNLLAGGQWVSVTYPVGGSSTQCTAMFDPSTGNGADEFFNLGASNSCFSINNPSANLRVRKILKQNTGGNKYLIAGNFGGVVDSFGTSATINKSARFLQNGTRDTSWTSAFTANSTQIFDVIERDLGVNISSPRFIFVGSFTSPSGRLYGTNSSGSLDATFPRGSGTTANINGVTQTGNKYVFVGEFTTFKGVSANRIVRTDTSASIDASFTGTGANAPLNVASREVPFTSASIVIGGGGLLGTGNNFTQYSGVNTNSTNIAQISRTGSLQST